MTELKRIMTEFKVCRRKARGYVRLREVSEKICKGRGLKKIRKALENEQRQKNVHFVKYGDLPSDYKIVFDQNNNKVYYVSELKLWMYEGSSNVAEVEKWKESE